jgi:intracellular septation protein A
VTDDNPRLEEAVELPPITVRSILLGSGPRFARDAFGPVLTFYVLWRTVGIVAGIVGATAISLVAYRYERRRERAALMVRVSLAFVLLQATVGIVTRSAELYLIQPVILSAAFGLAFLLSPLLGRPLAGVFASELYPFPEAVRESQTYRRVFGRISIAWGVYQLFRSALRAVTLLGLGVDLYVVVNFVTGVPMITAMMSWSIWYGIRSFRRSEEWGWAIEALESGALPPGADPAEA